MSKVELQVRQLMPEDLPLVDDNSDFTLMGYQNFLIEPRVGTSSTSSLQLISILLENADLLKSNLASVCLFVRPSILSNIGILNTMGRIYNVELTLIYTRQWRPVDRDQ